MPAQKIGLMLLLIHSVLGQDSACPGKENVVQMCKNNSQQADIVYLDGGTSFGLTGSCTCRIKAETSPADVTLNMTSIATACAAFIDFTSLRLTSKCDSMVPGPVSRTVTPGEDVFVTLARKHDNETTNFCVEIEHTNAQNGGKMAVTCQPQDIHDVLNKDIFLASSTLATAVSSPTETTAPSQSAQETLAPSSIVQETTAPSNTVQETVVPTNSAQDTAAPTNTVLSESGSTSQAVQDTAATSQPAQETIVPSTTVPHTAEPSQVVSGTESETLPTAASQSASPPETAEPQESASQTAVQVQSSMTEASVAASSTGTVPESTATNETISPSSQTSNGTEETTGLSDAVLASTVVVSVLGGIFLILLILASVVYFRDKSRARQSALQAKKDRIRQSYENRGLIED